VASNATEAEEAIRLIDSGKFATIDWTRKPFSTAYHLLFHYADDADIRMGDVRYGEMQRDGLAALAAKIRSTA
jgi:hypothetical protein